MKITKKLIPNHLSSIIVLHGVNLILNLFVFTYPFNWEVYGWSTVITIIFNVYVIFDTEKENKKNLKRQEIYNKQEEERKKEYIKAKKHLEEYVSEGFENHKHISVTTEEMKNTDKYHFYNINSSSKLLTIKVDKEKWKAKTVYYYPFTGEPLEELEKENEKVIQKAILSSKRKVGTNKN